MKNKKTASITIDVETDWGGRQLVDEPNVGIEKELPWILNLLKKHKIKATFFINANLLPKYTKQLLKIKKHGHEIASHGFEHNDHSKISYSMLRKSFDACFRLFKKHMNTKPLGFRAPQFKINKELFKAVESSGFKYDSSIVAAVLPGRYANFKVKKEPYKLVGSKKLVELPISSINGINFPAGLLWGNKIGPFFFRLLASVFGVPRNFIFYLHPFDLTIKKYSFHVPWHIRMWYGFSISDPKQFLESLIIYLKEKEHKFVTLQQLVHQNKNQHSLP